MTTPNTPANPGHARYTYRLRVSSTALVRLLAEWDRCRWVWNACVAQSKQAHTRGETCGPATLDRLLTGWRGEHQWLRAGSSLPQQQTIRDFARSRTKTLKDITDRLPMRQRAGMPRFKKKALADPTLNYTRRGFRLTDGRLQLAGGISLTVVWSRDLPAAPSSVRVFRDSLGHWQCSFLVAAQTEPLPAIGQVIGIDWGVREIATTTSDSHDLPHFRPKFLARSSMARKAADAAIGATKRALLEMGRKHGRDVRLVHPAYTTMDCGQCGARAKHALPLSERTYRCTACGTVSPSDRNSAWVILVRAGLSPAGADRVRLDRPPGDRAA